MKTKMYSIFDQKAAIFHPPLPQRTHGEAERTFASQVMATDSKIGQFPEDYDLYYVGEYDQETGKFEPLDTPHHVVKAVTVLSRN